MKEPEFDAAYRKAKRAAFSQSIARLHQITSSDGCLLLSPVFRSMSLHRGAPGGHLRSQRPTHAILEQNRSPDASFHSLSGLRLRADLKRDNMVANGIRAQRR